MPRGEYQTRPNPRSTKWLCSPAARPLGRVGQVRCGVHQHLEGAFGVLVGKHGGVGHALDPPQLGRQRLHLVLDGDVILPADGATITERRRLGYSGLITVALPVNAAGELVGDPAIKPFGVPVEEDREDFIADATDSARRAFDASLVEDKLREAVRLAVRRCATAWTGKKPLVDVTLVRTGG